MEYFLLKTQSGNPVPQICSWYGKLDERKLNRKHYKELSTYIMLDMKTGMDILYPDVLTEPFLLVSKGVMDVIRMYEEDMPFLFAALYDTDKGESVSYYLPILAEGNEECGDAIYHIRNKERWEIRIRIDLVESLLARGAEGMELIQIGETGKGDQTWEKNIW